LTKQKITDGMITFEKDDDNIIHFIASGANLRMHCFSIEEQTFNEVKNMAGNIVPAIASTNSIVSGI
jgi:ubiquitin-like 1-activating enzyme E1 B